MSPIRDPSYSSLYIEMFNNGLKVASGTGFILKSKSDKPYLITNRHNVTGRNNFTGKFLEGCSPPDQIQIYHHKAFELGHWVMRSESLVDSERNFWIEHPRLGPTADFVALPLRNLDNTQLYSHYFTIRNPEDFLGPSDRVNVIGFPFGQTAGGYLPIWLTGFIASEMAINYIDLPIFLIDCRTRPANSGSPVVFYNNNYDFNRFQYIDDKPPNTKLLGIYSGRIDKESDIGLVWKASSIKELIDSLD